MGLANLTNSLVKKYKIEVQDLKSDETYERISTGSFIVDYLTGGGFAKGKVNEVYGPPGAGKSTLALASAAWVQKNLKKSVVLFDAEHSLNKRYAALLGVDFDPNMFQSYKENSAEKIRSIIKELFETAADTNLGMIIIDSAAAVIPEGWNAVDNAGAAVGERARFWSQFIPYISSEVDKTGVTLVYVNQIRNKIDPNFNKWTPEEEKEATIGGKAIEYFRVLSVRLRASTKIGVEKKYIDPDTGIEGYKADGVNVQAKVIKNKTGGHPFLQGHFSLMFNIGIDNLADIVPVLLHKKVIQQVDAQGNASDSGQFFAYADLNGEKYKVKSQETLIKDLRNRPKLLDTWVEQMGYAFRYFTK